MGVCDKHFVGLIGVSSPPIFLLEVWQVIGLGVCWLVGWRAWTSCLRCGLSPEMKF